METYLDRLLLINKPLGWTSFDVVNKLRNKMKIKKIGHAGTLDPLATGLLIQCTGKMTKRIDEYQAQEKEYTGKFIIGQSTPSHDLETKVTETNDISLITDEAIHFASHKFKGVIQQVPPLHSAIKVDGKRAYKLARKGKEVELKPREVTIHIGQVQAALRLGTASDPLANLREALAPARPPPLQRSPVHPPRATPT